MQPPPPTLSDPYQAHADICYWIANYWHVFRTDQTYKEGAYFMIISVRVQYFASVRKVALVRRLNWDKKNQQGKPVSKIAIRKCPIGKFGNNVKIRLVQYDLGHMDVNVWTWFFGLILDFIVEKNIKLTIIISHNNLNNEKYINYIIFCSAALVY